MSPEPVVHVDPPAYQSLIAQAVAAAPVPGRADELARLAELTALFAEELRAEPALAAAMQLHNFVCERWINREQVAEACGPRTAWLVEEAQRILSEPAQPGGRGKPRTRRRVRHYVAAYRDPELGLLAVAQLWARFQLAENAPLAQRHLFADEARHVLLPLLDMMGMRQLAETVESWLWRLHEPDSESIDQTCGRLFDHVRSQLQAVMPQATLRCYPCAPRQMRLAVDDPQRVGRGGRNWIPPIDVHVLVDDEEQCYRVLYWVHHLFQAIDGSFADDLREGRINGARTLQTTAGVTFDGQRPRVTFHICTHTMNEINRWGLAAIFARSRQQADLPNAWWNNAAAGYEQIAAAEMGSLPEILYVFSPQGQLFRFHRGCTVVDFAYHVHTELADHCERFYINDEVVEPTTPLHHLDLVALAHDPRAPGPTQIWLNAAHTSRARNSIERFLKRRGLGVDQGQKILDQRRRLLEAHYGFNLPEYRVAQATVKVMRQMKLGRIEELLAEVAAGRIVADRILHPLFADEVIRQIQLSRELGVRPHQIQLAQCCRARPGDDIVGLPSRRGGEIMKLRVHRAGCVRVHSGDEQIQLKWRLHPRLKLLVQLELTAHDADGLLGDALAQIYARRPRVTVRKVEAVAEHGVARARITVEAESAEVMAQIVDALQTLPEHTVVEVRQLRLPPSEVEAASQLSGAGTINPYSRLPVNEQTMFFGRSRELLQIYEWLRGGAGVVWLMGQKRVGKTSLLLHLKNYYLPDRGFVLAFVDFQLMGNLAESNIFFEIANAVYSELQGEPRLGDLSAPLPAVFAHQPPVQLIQFLSSIQSRLGANRLVLLLDEFSRTTDAYLKGELDRSFFDAWRGVILATAPAISYITVFQQQSYNELSLHAQHEVGDPSWHLMELGEKLVLKSLTPEEVRRLIEWPMRNFLEYTPETLDKVATLTGGNPFLIQAFCFKLTAHLARQDRRVVDPADIEAVQAEFMQPTESVFAHFLDVIKGRGHRVTQQLAHLAGAGGPVGWSAIHAALPNYPLDMLRRTLAALVDNDILFQPAPDQWQFSSLLFQQWLDLNSL